MNKIIHYLDKITHITGTSIAWLTLLMVIVTSAVVILRKVMGIGLIGLQESVTYMHAMVFMLAAAWALQRGAHVRVDIFYRRFSIQQRAWVDALGSLVFTLPLMIFIAISSWDFVCASWRIHEGSSDSGGLAIVFLLKSVLPFMAINIGLQVIAELLRNLVLLMHSES